MGSQYRLRKVSLLVRFGSEPKGCHQEAFIVEEEQEG
jgi:hypothetical protein